MTAEVTTSASTSAATMENKMNEPNATLYVSNIDWKIKKPILRRALHTLFSRHGKVCGLILDFMRLFNVSIISYYRLI
jgi:hypothetical protein